MAREIAASGGFTAMQEAFIDYMVSGIPQKQAAILAGYSEATASVAGSKLMAIPAIVDEINRKTTIEIDTKVAPLAVSVLAKVLRDDTIKPDTRVRAALGVLELSRRNKEKQPERARDPSQMSVAELEGYIRAAESKLQDVTPRQTDEKA